MNWNSRETGQSSTSILFYPKEVHMSYQSSTVCTNPRCAPIKSLHFGYCWTQYSNFMCNYLLKNNELIRYLLKMVRNIRYLLYSSANLCATTRITLRRVVLQYISSYIYCQFAPLHLNRRFLPILSFGPKVTIFLNWIVHQLHKIHRKSRPAPPNSMASTSGGGHKEGTPD